MRDLKGQIGDSHKCQLLNHRGIFRFSHFNHLQSGRNRPNRATVLSFGG